MKTILRITFLLFMSFFLFNFSWPWEKVDPKKVVVKIKPNLHPESVQLLEQIASYMESTPDDTGIANLMGARLRNIAQGGHGSGFVYVDSKGTNYIITNKHVVSTAFSADVTFQSGKVFKNAKIFYTDPNSDLAVLVFNGNKNPVKSSFTFETSPDEEGDVYAAGYPGESAKWSFSKGTITNKDFDLDGKSYIKHSAPMDPGSSGGPLLQKCGLVFKDYCVVGINTMQITNQQLNNFSIPASEIEAVVNKLDSVKKLESRSVFEANAKTNAIELSENLSSKDLKPEGIFNLISFELIAQRGLESLSQMNLLPEQQRNTFLLLLLVDPIRALQTLVAVRLSLDFTIEKGRGSVSFERISTSSESKRIKSIHYVGSNRTQREILWTVEHGHVRIADVVGLRNFNDMQNIPTPIEEVSNVKYIPKHLIAKAMIKCIEVSDNSSESIANCLGGVCLKMCQSINNSEATVQSCIDRALVDIQEILKEVEKNKQR